MKLILSVVLLFVCWSYAQESRPTRPDLRKDLSCINGALGTPSCIEDCGGDCACVSDIARRSGSLKDLTARDKRKCKPQISKHCGSLKRAGNRRGNPAMKCLKKMMCICAKCIKDFAADGQRHCSTTVGEGCNNFFTTVENTCPKGYLDTHDHDHGTHHDHEHHDHTGHNHD